MKKMKKENVDQLQQISDEYLKKRKSKIRIRIFAGIAALASTVVLLAGCDKMSEDQTGYENVTYEATLREDSLANFEEELEKEVAACLSEKTGLNIKIIDMRDIDVVRDNGKCHMVVSGIMIDDEDTKLVSLYNKDKNEILLFDNQQTSSR